MAALWGGHELSGAEREGSGKGELSGPAVGIGAPSGCGWGWC